MGQEQPKSQTDERNFQMELFQSELERTGIPLETVLKRYNIQNVSQMTPDIYEKALNGLRKTKTKGAA